VLLLLPAVPQAWSARCHQAAHLHCHTCEDRCTNKALTAGASCGFGGVRRVISTSPRVVETAGIASTALYLLVDSHKMLSSLADLS
jgi:hypothetical protein